ncbi:superinfection immunity protein [Xanthobacter autotrophicus]|uniref:superinfection immunity protein n=1 Tax=Xanthobacter autotrophicus TaxID=280 RepID=UPI00372ABCC2
MTEEAVKAILTLAFIAAVYFLPAIIAHRRGHRNSQAILVLNLFLGWTGLGWIGAMVWAYTAP